MFAATDTTDWPNHISCLEDNDDDGSCKEIFPEQKVLRRVRRRVSLIYQTAILATSLYWPVRNQWRSIQSADSHDFKGVQEGTPVYAVKDGKVEESADLTGCDSNGHDGRYCRDGMRSYGRIIKIEHSINGKSPMVYAHLSKRVAQTGDEVKAGQIIGYSGNSGNSSGPHLHIDFSGEYTAVDWLRSQKPELPPKDGAEVSGGTNCPEKEITGSKDYTDDTENPIPKGEQVAEQAKKWADNDKTCGFMGGTCLRKCLGIVSELWKSVGKPSVVTGHPADPDDDTALNAYKYFKKNGWVNKTKNIPIGAIMWSMDPKDPGQGHAYTYVGDGKIASNDIKVVGQYHIVPADWIETKWNHEFLGWSEWHK
jgi:murein DD-endopeptidase MepM/ murein hydrolase activator NlpD